MSDENTSKSTGLTFFILMWVVLFGLAIMFFDNLIAGRKNPNSSPESRLNGERQEVVLRRNSQGHFIATGLVNNSEVVFIIDTGATDVVLSEAAAQRAGLPKGAASRVNTANGVITVYNTQIETLKLGAITLRNVRASINPHMHDELALLGMSFLGQLEMRQKDRTLTLVY